MKIFHIRAPLPRNRKVGNKFYPPGQYCQKKTLCGQPITQHDIRFGWDAGSVGQYVCCEQCLAKKAESQKSPKTRD